MSIHDNAYNMFLQQAMHLFCIFLVCRHWISHKEILKGHTFKYNSQSQTETAVNYDKPVSWS